MMSEAVENNIESDIAEAEIYVSFQKYALAEKTIDSVLFSYPHNKKAVEIKARIETERTDPPNNYHVGFLFVLIGIAILGGALHSHYEGIALYGIGVCLILPGLSMIPDFLRYRWRPYKEGKINYLFKDIESKN